MLDMALWWASLVFEAILIVLTYRRRVSQLLPVFFAYLIWTFLSDVLGVFVKTRFPDSFLRFFMFEMPLDLLWQIAVIVELAWSVLRPYRSSLPRYTVAVLTGVILLTAVVIWPLAGISPLGDLPAQWHLLMRIQQTSSILRIVFFLALAGCSQLLAIGWRNRELQVATGLGIYSFASLIGAVLHAQLGGAHRYHEVDQFVTVGYFCSLLYWSVSFLQQEAPRTEFSPKMESLLLAMAGTAQAQRSALREIRKQDKP